MPLIDWDVSRYYQIQPSIKEQIKKKQKSKTLKALYYTEVGDLQFPFCLNGRRKRVFHFLLGIFIPFYQMCYQNFYAVSPNVGTNFCLQACDVHASLPPHNKINKKPKTNACRVWQFSNTGRYFDPGGFSSKPFDVYSIFLSFKDTD